MCDCIGVAIVWAGGHPGNVSFTPYTAFRRLAPAGMINVRIHVAVPPVFPGVGQIPGRGWLLFSEGDSRDELGGFESVFPGERDSKRHAVLR